MKLVPSSRILFVGDSITDCGSTSARASGQYEALGTGYVSLVDAHFTAITPSSNIRVLNRGVSGNTVKDLASRWDKDVLALQPDWLVLMIGINDVWRQFDQPAQAELHVPLEENRRILDDLVLQTRPRVQGMTMMSPYLIEPNAREPMRAMMDQYGKAMREIAESHACDFVDTQAAFNRVLDHRHPMNLAWDRVHPGPAGHLIIAQAFLESIGFPRESTRSAAWMDTA
jgi:lysophospholipase L1-like esterase